MRDCSEERHGIPDSPSCNSYEDVIRSHALKTGAMLDMPALERAIAARHAHLAPSQTRYSSRDAAKEQPFSFGEENIEK